MKNIHAEKPIFENDFNERISNCLESSKFSMTKLRLKDVKKLLTAAFICKKANILAGLICFSSIFTISFLYYYVSKS